MTFEDYNKKYIPNIEQRSIGYVNELHMHMDREEFQRYFGGEISFDPFDPFNRSKRVELVQARLNDVDREINDIKGKYVISLHEKVQEALGELEKIASN